MMTGRLLGLDGLVDLDDVELHLVQHVQHVVLEIRVGLVDLIDQQDHLFVGDKGLADLPHFDVFLDIAHIPLGVAETAVVEPGQGVVLVKRVDQLHARFDVEDDQAHLQGFGNGMGQHGFSCSRLAFQ